MQRPAVTLIRFCFALLVLFELANWVGVLHFSIDFTWLGLVATSAGVWILLELISRHLRKRTKKPLNAVAYGLAFLSVFLDAVGDISRWYSKVHVGTVYYDDMLHAFGSALGAGILLSIAVQTGMWMKRKPGESAAMIAVTTLALGWLYELEEFLEDAVVWDAAVRFGGLGDTARDLVANTLGIGIVLALALLLRRRR